MISTSTPALDLTKNRTDNSRVNSTEDQNINFASPSLRTIEAILNYSKNLEVKRSKFIQEIEFIRS